jgi:hypothetical protein
MTERLEATLERHGCGGTLVEVPFDVRALRDGVRHP